MKSKSMIPMVLGGLLGLVACAADPIQTSTNVDAGGGGGGGDDDPVADAAPVSNRVTEDLVAFYDFDGVLGQTAVNDTSGSATPLDLTIGDPLAVTWGAGFLTVTAPVVIQSAGPASAIISACAASNEISVEAWVKPSTITSGGRIVSNGVDAATRNFHLKQQDATYQVRVRTSQNAQGDDPDSITALGTATIDAVQHVIYSKNSLGQADIWINNIKQAPYSNAGSHANWDLSYPLVVANEISADRPWLGDLYMVAVYCRALSPAEVTQNYDEGY